MEFKERNNVGKLEIWHVENGARRKVCVEKNKFEKRRKVEQRKQSAITDLFEK